MLVPADWQRDGATESERTTKIERSVCERGEEREREREGGREGGKQEPSVSSI